MVSYFLIEKEDSMVIGYSCCFCGSFVSSIDEAYSHVCEGSVSS